MKPDLFPSEHPEWAQREAEDYLAQRRREIRRGTIIILIYLAIVLTLTAACLCAAL